MVRMQTVPVQPPRWMLRSVISMLLIVVFSSARIAYQAIQGPIEASVAARQLEDGVEGYVVGSTVATSSIPFAISLGMILLLLVIWVPFVVKWVRYMQLPESSEQS